MTSRNWVLILGWKYCEKRKVFSLALKDDRVEQCLFFWGGGGEFQSTRRCESHESCVFIVGLPACGCQKKSVVYETECRHAAVREVSRTRTTYSTETHTSDFILNTFWSGKPVQFFQDTDTDIFNWIGQQPLSMGNKRLTEPTTNIQWHLHPNLQWDHSISTNTYTSIIMCT